MSDVGSLVGFISTQLNDADPGDENIRWSKSLISQYVVNAVIAAAALSPNLFSHPKEIVLKRGTCIHEVCDECDKFGGVLSVDGTDCSVEKDLGKKHQKLLSGSNASACSQVSNSFVTGGIEYSDASPCFFRTGKPTPKDRDVTALINCIEYPDPADMLIAGDDYILPKAIVGELRSAIYEHVLYQAKEKDLELDGAQPQQTAHFNRFLLLLNSNRSAEAGFAEIE